MELRKPRWLKRAEDGMRPLDLLPRRVALAAGGLLGAGAGALVAWSGEPWAAAVAAGVLGAAGWMAATAEGISVLGEPVRKGLSEEVQRALGMRELAGGTFWMGSDPGQERYSDDQPRQQEKVAPFSMAAFLVRQSLYTSVMGDTPSDPKGDDLPVNHVSWFDAIRFCNALSVKEGLRPAYKVGKGDATKVDWDSTADGVRLPTEIEWEYAARAGTTTEYSFGNDRALLSEHAWWGENADGRPHPVGTRSPNPWGLFDVHGNVYEWCWDTHGPYGKARSTGGSRVLRGGSFWLRNPKDLRSAFRNWRAPGDRSPGIGFRCARSVARQP